MNITPQAPNIPIPTVVNPPTDALRRENHQREVITQPAAAQQSAAEKGVASERERARSPAQNNEQIDFESLRKQAELANSTVSDKEEESTKDDKQEGQPTAEGEIVDQADEEKQADTKDTQADGKQLDFAEQKILNELQQRDREVRSHERAHAATGGATTGAPSYSFEVGPDGNKYAVEGEVSVDLSPVKGNPRATIAKMQKVHNAALAPANPSIQDTRIANAAAQLIAQAQSELLASQLEDPTREKELGRSIGPRGSFSDESSVSEQSNDFDRQINRTLDAQERIAPSRSEDINQRAVRIESFYANINHAYEKPATHQFELTA